jgi:hypothetical protein
MDSVTAYLAHLYGGFMEAQPEAVPLLRRFFYAHATRDWAAEVPEQVMELATPAMSAMHRALERGDDAEALAHLKVWAGCWGLTGATRRRGRWPVLIVVSSCGANVAAGRVMAWPQRIRGRHRRYRDGHRDE